MAKFRRSAAMANQSSMYRMFQVLLVVFQIQVPGVSAFLPTGVLPARARTTANVSMSRKHTAPPIRPTRVGSRSATKQQLEPPPQQEQQQIEPHDTTLLSAHTLDEQLRTCQTTTAARYILQQAFATTTTTTTSTTTTTKQPLFGSISIPRGASTRGLSDGDFRVMTRTSNTPYDLMDVIDLTGSYELDQFALTLFQILVSSSVASTVAQQNLPGPEILRFVVVWVLTFAPLLVLGRFGLDAAKEEEPEQDETSSSNNNNNNNNNKTPIWLSSILSNLDFFRGNNIDRQRRLQHEAGHLVLAHLLGWPVRGYTITNGNSKFTAVTLYPMSDPDAGPYKARQLGFDTTSNTRREPAEPMMTTNADAGYFSPQGRGGRTVQEQSVFRNETNTTAFTKRATTFTTWPYRGMTDETLDALTAISVAGVCAEVLAFGNAYGGRADWAQLESLLSSTELDGRERENRVRFALAFSLAQLRQHLPLVDVVAAVMERGGSLAECLLAMEQERGNQQDWSMDEVQRRTEQFGTAHNNVGNQLVQQLGLSKTKSLWEDEQQPPSPQINGSKRRGKEEPRVFLPGDDPFYVAAGIAIVFLLWASSGGLTLH